MANDNFQVWLTEKIWELIPATYRHEDGIAATPNVLRGLVEVMAKQGAILRRSQDRLWEDQFIELCDDWAVPYIGDLLKTRLVSVLNTRGRRIDVAKTIYYRRRAGTLRVLEELIRDITGWEGKVVENFRRLARARHDLDPHPALSAGRRSGTMPGGFVDLRRPVVAQLTGGPFEESHRTPDARLHRGESGRFGIPKLAFHLYRLVAYHVRDIVPRSVTDGGGKTFFTFDPSGRGVPLFIAPHRAPSWDDWASAREWELPAPMRCRLLGDGQFMVTQATIEAVGGFVTEPEMTSLLKLKDLRFQSESRFRMTLDTLPVPLPAGTASNIVLRFALVADCGLAGLVAPAAPATPSLRITLGVDTIYPWQLAAASITDPADFVALDKRIVVDPARGRLLRLGPPQAVTADYHYGFSGPIGAGCYERPGLPLATQTLSAGGAVPAAAGTAVVEILDNRTYGPLANQAVIANLTIQARSGERPYLVMATDWALTAPAAGARLVLDGLWIGAADADRSIVLSGDYAEVILRNVTLDPGGEDAGGNTVFAVKLVVTGHVERLTVQSSIAGRIRTSGGGTIDTLAIEDTILQAPPGDILAVDLARGDVHLDRVTVFGGLRVHRLWASEALLTGDPADPTAINVADVQSGCVRYSAFREGGHLPHPYASYGFTASGDFFTSRALGDPGYAQLAESAPVELRRGAENGSEIGAFSSLVNPVKLEGLQAKVSELMPFGLIPLFTFET